VTLLELGLYFALLSPLAVGGAGSIVPEMQRYVVDVKGWMSADDFVQLFAVAQAAPGPNMLIAALVGWKVAGWSGAVVALAGICAPAGVLAWWAGRLWERFRAAPWREAIRRALVPLMVGMVLSGGYVIATPGAPDWRLWLIAAASAAAMFAGFINPLWILAAGGALGGVLL
jgi:chromate transporter